MRVPGSRKRWIVALVLVVLLIGGTIRAADHPATIYYFHVVDQHTLVVGVSTGPWSWTRVTGVSEMPSTIAVWVSSLDLPLPGSDVRHARGVGALSIVSLAGAEVDVTDSAGHALAFDLTSDTFR